jgi:hypothetical protein
MKMFKWVLGEWWNRMMECWVMNEWSNERWGNVILDVFINCFDNFKLKNQKANFQ